MFPHKWAVLFVTCKGTFICLNILFNKSVLSLNNFKSLWIVKRELNARRNRIIFVSIETCLNIFSKFIKLSIYQQLDFQKYIKTNN